jgi:hypothetical protein
VLAGGVVLGALVGVYLLVHGRSNRTQTILDDVLAATPPRQTWRMPPLNGLVRPAMSTQRKIGLLTLRGYLIVAFALVVLKIVQAALG